MKYAIKTTLAVLLLGCLFDVPYGYFQVVRLAGCALFIWLAYLEYQEKRVITNVLCVGCALLLNPIFKVHFTRKIWNNIDFAIAILLFVWMLIDILTFIKRKKAAPTA